MTASLAVPSALSAREQLARTATDLLDRDPRVALLYAEISGQFFREAERRHPDRVVNVGIREQLLVSAAAGMALVGLRPLVHTFGSFLVERAFEQIKLDFGHQGVGGVLVGYGGSFDVAAGGRTHLSPGDMALMDTLGAQLHAPSTPAEVDAVIRAATTDPDGTALHYVRVVGQANTQSFPVGPGFHVVRRADDGPFVLALGPVLDAVLAATDGRAATVLYASTIRPFDAAGLRAALPARASHADVVLVEPWLAGTSARCVADALVDTPHRLLALGVGRGELRRYGRPEDHVRAHGLDAAGLRASIDAFSGAGPGPAPESPSPRPRTSADHWRSAHWPSAHGGRRR